MKRVNWGKADGKEVELITIANEILQAEITNYGAALVSLMVPDRDGQAVDVVLGYDSLERYLHQNCFLGVVVGRCANRIKNACFTINGQDYQVEPNEGSNHLHGGSKGLWAVPWNIESVGDDFVVMKYFSPDGEGGYPGNLECTVEYRLVGRQLIFRHQGISDKDTVLNITQHSYFNLKGSGKGNIEDHLICIAADHFTEMAPDLCSTGRILPLEGTPMDLRETVKIGDRLLESHEQMTYAKGFDLNYILNDRDQAEKPVVDLYSSQSGIGMTVATDMEGLHFYTGNFLDVKNDGKKGETYGARGGLCFETQHFPGAINIDSFPSPIIKKGKIKESSTVYTFYNK